MVFSAFKTTAKLTWVSLLLLTVLLEVTFLPREIYPPYFYTYKCVKGLLFFTLGYLTPIAFWRFNSLGRGFLWAVLSAVFVEVVQGFFPGHRFSTAELLLKLAVLFAGFAFALNARYEGRIGIGSWQIRLLNEHLRHS